MQRIATALEGQGFRVARGFDLREALAAQAEECPCPYHGTERCTCSYTVLLIYGPDAAGRFVLLPQRIAVHSHQDETWLTLLPTVRPSGSTEPAEVSPKPWEARDENDPLTAALEARLARGLAAAVSEAPA
ncbi:MAG: hypothetical protein ACE5MB_06635 [Anaerolineae bacterium]